MDNHGIFGIPRHFHHSESAALRAVLDQFAVSPMLQPLKQKIADDDRFKALEGMQIARGDGGGGSVDVHNLLVWWVWRANDVGQDTANSELESFLSSEEIDSLVCVWLFGTFVQERVELFNGIELWPIKEMPYSSEKSDFANRFIGGLGWYYFGTAYCFDKKSKTKKDYEREYLRFGR